MKAILFLAATVLVSQMALADATDVLRDYETSNKVTCEETGSSSMQICINVRCEHKEYYTCGDDRITLHVVSYQYGDKSEESATISPGGF